jgi:PQQ-dependent catabolism-associated CXXCW motif protein
MDRYLQDNLRDATGGDPAHPLVIYCKANCWHSWNLAKRAIALGYSHVAWYPEGVEGWRAAGLPLEPARARPRPAE